MTSTSTITTTIHLDWTTAETVYIIIKKDMPEYGVKRNQVVYLCRVSANDGTYYIVRWSASESGYSCPCKWGAEHTHIHTCRHIKNVNASSIVRATAQRARAQHITIFTSPDFLYPMRKSEELGLWVEFYTPEGKRVAFSVGEPQLAEKYIRVDTDAWRARVWQEKLDAGEARVRAAKDALRLEALLATVRCALCKSMMPVADMGANGLVCKHCQEKQEQEFLTRARQSALLAGQLMPVAAPMPTKVGQAWLTRAR